MLVLYFAAGVTVFSMRKIIPLRAVLFAICGIFSLYALLDRNLIYLTPLPIAYCTAWIGLREIPKLPIIFSGDYSYGIYLYGFVVQQAAVHFFPLGWLANSVISIVAVSFLAALSWHCVEKPTLRLKKYLKSEKLFFARTPLRV
jgi:peptidoglycan/LPS O-acetylase OafA/YrhL